MICTGGCDEWSALSVAIAPRLIKIAPLIPVVASEPNNSHQGVAATTSKALAAASPWRSEAARPLRGTLHQHTNHD
jgi:hypothetical protein